MGSTANNYGSRFYETSVQSIIQYSMLPYHITKKKTKNRLQIIQNKALKIILKANRNTSIKLLHAMANIPTINERLKTLSKKYLLHSSSVYEEILAIINSYNTAEIKPKKSILNFLN